MICGYARVSTLQQNLDMQLDALRKFGCEKIFEEKLSGTKKDRPELEELLKHLRKGDTLVVFKLDRISRSTKHLIELMDWFNERDITFVSIHENIDTSTAMGKFVFKILAALAEMERDITAERTKEALASARARGRFGGRPRAKKDNIRKALTLYDSGGYSIAEITKETGIRRSTLYKYLNERKY